MAPSGYLLNLRFRQWRMMLAMIAWYERTKILFGWRGSARWGKTLQNRSSQDGYAFFPCMGGAGEEAEENILKSFDGPVCQGQPFARWPAITKFG